MRHVAQTVCLIAAPVLLVTGCTIGSPGAGTGALDRSDDTAVPAGTAFDPYPAGAQLQGDVTDVISGTADGQTQSSPSSLPLSLPLVVGGAVRQDGSDGNAGSGAVSPADTASVGSESDLAPGVDGCTPGLARRDGDSLVVDGQPFAFFGVNARYLIDADFPEDRVEDELAALARRNVNAVRIWFLPGYDPDRLERTLDAGARQGIRFVVTLDDNVPKSRHWFFGDEDEQVFRPHARETVSRFRNRAEILMWEPTNEANCHDEYDDACVDSIEDWLTMASRLIKAEDPCHLVSSGVIGAGNYERDLSSYRRLHSRDSIDVLSVHRGVDEERERETETADELGMPIVHGEIYDVAYDESCSLLEGGKVRKRRAERIKDDFRDVVRDGADGYLLWDYAAGSVDMPDGSQRHFCSVFGYELVDPLWIVMAEAELPPPVPWQRVTDE